MPVQVVPSAQRPTATTSTSLPVPELSNYDVMDTHVLAPSPIPVFAPSQRYFLLNHDISRTISHSTTTTPPLPAFIQTFKSYLRYIVAFD